MNILVCSGTETQHWQFFLNYFNIDYQLVDLYEFDKQKFSVPVNINNSILVADYFVLEQLYRYSFNDLIEFLKFNKIILVANMDAPVIFRDNLSWLTQIDAAAPKNSIYCLLECAHINYRLQNIQVDLDAESKFFDIIDQRSSIIIKKQINKDFLLLLGRENSGRTYLWDCVHNQSITNNSIAIYHKKQLRDKNDRYNLIGNFSSVILPSGKSSVPCTDFYNHCAFEIVVETELKNLCWFTEKTLRPIAGKTPFVLLSTPGSLAKLRDLGFKTFNNYINESYDNELDLKKRTDMIVDVVADIVRNGSINFSVLTRDIVEYNWNRLLELKGTYTYHKDLRYLKLLSTLNVEC